MLAVQFAVVHALQSEPANDAAVGVASEVAPTRPSHQLPTSQERGQAARRAYHAEETARFQRVVGALDVSQRRLALSLGITHRMVERKLGAGAPIALSTADLRLMGDRGCRKVALAILAELVADLRAA